MNFEQRWEEHQLEPTKVDKNEFREVYKQLNETYGDEASFGAAFMTYFWSDENYGIITDTAVPQSLATSEDNMEKMAEAYQEVSKLSEDYDEILSLVPKIAVTQDLSDIGAYRAMMYAQNSEGQENLSDPVIRALDDIMKGISDSAHDEIDPSQLLENAGT